MSPACALSHNNTDYLICVCGHSLEDTWNIIIVWGVVFFFFFFFFLYCHLVTINLVGVRF